MSLNESNQIEFSYLNINFTQSETIKINKNFLTNLESTHIYDNLNQIKFAYLNNDYLMTNSALEHSRFLNCTNVNGSQSSLKNQFLSSYYTNEPLLRHDWIYSPLISELKKYEAKSKQSNGEKQIVQDHVDRSLSVIVNTLKFIYLNEVYFGDYLDKNINITLRYSRLVLVYLFDSELFLDKQIVTYMYLIFLKYSKDARRPLNALNFNQKIPGIISFYDLYQSLLANYDSSSFGDYVFSLYLVAPLQQNLPVRYRQLFWSDYTHLFKFIRFDTEKSKCLIPFNDFIQPNEKNLHMIRLYSQVILDRSDLALISNSKLAYVILVAHLNSYIFEHTNKYENKINFDFKKLLVKNFQSLENQVTYDLFNQEKNVQMIHKYFFISF